MATNKRITDLTDFTSVLPYASELFGIYQPLLGWKGKRNLHRFGSGLARDKSALLHALTKQFPGDVALAFPSDHDMRITTLKPAVLTNAALRATNSVVLNEIAQKLPAAKDYREDVWASILSDQSMGAIFANVLVPHYTQAYVDQAKTGFRSSLQTPRGAHAALGANAQSAFKSALSTQLKYESAIAGALQHLATTKSFAALHDTFYQVADNSLVSAAIIKGLVAADAANAYLNLDNLDPQSKADLENVALSPISVVHLFRQYFFELDTFLGTPVSHVWMSPGSMVELIEISTRKTIVEKTLETVLETTTKAESSTTNEEEISDAVKEDNKQDIKFGASVTASYASITATSSFDFANSQQQSREETHRRMRQQTEKLSSEIRRSFKSTYKTVTESTDTSSKRYVLKNDTAELINYELRRKMRQVGVQVQDVGSYLCWQTYVDDPGMDLGIAKLIHIAKSPDQDGIPHPEEIPLQQPFSETRMITIPFISIDDSDADNEEIYTNGHEVDDDDEKIQSIFAQEFVCEKSKYVLSNITFDAGGAPVSVSLFGAITNADNRATCQISLDYADFQKKNSTQVKAILYWTPTADANDEAIKKNAENTAAFRAAEREAFQKAFVENAKERVKLASKIQLRRSDDLREEERIVVYRRLIQDMLTQGVPQPDDRTRHVVAELINAIFDVDKMLYFVAPEWWRPRMHHNHQQLAPNKPPQPKFEVVANAWQNIIESTINHHLAVSQIDSGNIPQLNSSSVGWGGVGENGRDNYYITEDSDPARFGSSLGWLLQLDGDSLRNAFLNAPWVKAVIPIRPGREEAAINWLKGVEGFNGVTDADIYHTANPNEKDINGNPLDGQKLINVLIDLAKKIERKHREGAESGQYPKDSEVANPELVDAANVVTATPIDRVYEHGFYPLKDSFRANVNGNYEIFDGSSGLSVGKNELMLKLKRLFS